MQFIITIERDQFPDPEKYPDGGAWRAQIDDSDGPIDGQGDIATYEEAREITLSTLERLLDWGHMADYLKNG